MIRRIVACIDRGNGQGPVWNIITAFCRYGLLDLLYDSVLSGDYIPMSEFKKLVMSIAHDIAVRSCKVSGQLYSSLTMYNTCLLNKKQRICWWDVVLRQPEHVNKCRLIIRLLLNVVRLGRERCKLCQYGMNTTTHILFECQCIDVRESRA